MAITSVITHYRRVKLAQITSGDINVLSPVTQIAFGDGGVDAVGNPLEPSENQTKLNHEVERYDIDSINYPTDTTSRYVATIPSADLPGVEISEMALVDADGNLCAIKNMYKKKKDSDVKFTFEFDDEF